MLMANTVNDVMNVIASPDWGIKNIAGTNQEILAILSGVHNSKNNIHAIVDDIRTLLQKLVTTTTEKKPIEIDDKSTKINRKNIQNILDETKGIRKAIDSLTKVLEKQGGKEVVAAVAKLSDKASQKVADAMVKDIEKQKKGGGMSALVDAFTKLKDISLKDLIFGKRKIKLISNIFKNAKKDLKIDEKGLAAIIKLVNAAPEMIKSLSKVNRKVNKLIKNETVKKIGEILTGENSILAMSRILEKNEKTFNNANKVTKNISELVSSLKKTMRKMFFASLWSKAASNGVESIDNVLNKVFPLTKKLTKNKKNVETSTKVAKKITVLIGNLLVTSIFLTMAVVTGIPAILGAMLLSKTVDKIMPAVKKLSRNKKHMGKAVSSALLLITFTGLMAVTSLLLASIAITGIPALLGSIFMLGIIYVNVFAFKMLSKSLKTIAIGSISMLLMSLSLLLFSSTIEKITAATKGVTFKQVGVIASMIVLLGASVMVLGIPALFPFILMGSLAIGIMGFALRPFAKTLGILAKATENMKMKQVFLVSGALMSLGLTFSSMAVMLPLVLLGAITIRSMVKPLATFVESLKIISDMESVPTKKLRQVLSAMRSVASFFKGNKLRWRVTRNARRFKKIMPPFVSAAWALSAVSKMDSPPTKVLQQILGCMRSIAHFFRWNPLSYKAVWNARKYERVMKPFMKSVHNLSKLKDMGTLPIKLVHQALDAMKIVSNFFENNKLKSKTIRNARKYKWMMRPFGSIVHKLSKLKEMGTLPIKLVYQSLDAMKTIANYYENNPISPWAILSSWRYSRMLRPFGFTIRQLTKLKEMGTLPMRLVYQTLDAMKTISNYYDNNPISPWTILSSWRYSRMLRPFGYTIKQLTKLKEMGTLPMRLVEQALGAIGTIVGFYQNNQMDFWDALITKGRANRITRIVESFGDAVKTFKKLKEIREIPTGAVDSVLNSISGILDFYQNVTYSGNIDGKSEYTKLIVDRFTSMAADIQDKFAGIREINLNAVLSITIACRSIIHYYKYTNFKNLTRRKVLDMNDCVWLFTYAAKSVQEIYFKKENFTSIMLAIGAMKRIMKFLKRDTLGPIQRRRARKNIAILSHMAGALSTLSSVKPSNISSIGDALSTTLGEVNAIDIGQVEAVTNMFNAFNGINQSENIINKFAESVKEFTTVCQNLMNAMGLNTDAINNMESPNKLDITSVNTAQNNMNDLYGTGLNENVTNNQTDGIRIANVDEIAKTIADKINGALSIDIPDTQVQLLINGSGGNEWTISRY